MPKGAIQSGSVTLVSAHGALLSVEIVALRETVLLVIADGYGKPPLVEFHVEAQAHLLENALDLGE